MRYINIEIEVNPIEPDNPFSRTTANKKSSELINKITEAISNFDTTGIFFTIKINSEM